MKKVDSEIISDVNSLLEILISGKRDFNKILIQKGKRGEKLNKIIKEARNRRIPFQFVDRYILNKIVKENKGVAAFVSPVKYSDFMEVLESSTNPLFVILNGIEDPRNFGAIIRTSEACGVEGIIVRERRSSGITPSVYASSSGAVEFVKIIRVNNIGRAIEELKFRRIKVVGADKEGEDYWFKFDYTNPVAIVFGSEGKGITRIVKEKCDKILSIPMAGRVNSLNVSVAAGIFLYEIFRQRKLKKS
ncbi:MAG: 23S rRNA (guanosine(2251)-2'-O)-methyltransferase RlmB [Acidobacteriota bacterium]